MLSGAYPKTDGEQGTVPVVFRISSARQLDAWLIARGFARDHVHTQHWPESFRLGQRPNMRQPGALPLDERTRRTTRPSPNGATSRAGTRLANPNCGRAKPTRAQVSHGAPTLAYPGRTAQKIGLEDSRPGAMPLAISCWAVGPQNDWLASQVAVGRTDEPSMLLPSRL